jgi:hypothetical protein
MLVLHKQSVELIESLLLGLSIHQWLCCRAGS